MESWKMRVHGRPQPPFYFHREVGPPWGHSISTYALNWLKFDPPSPLVRTRTLDTHPPFCVRILGCLTPPPISKRKFLDIQNDGERLCKHSREIKMITSHVFHKKFIILFKQNSIILEQGLSNSFGPRAT